MESEEEELQRLTKERDILINKINELESFLAIRLIDKSLREPNKYPGYPNKRIIS
jgi:hypothetical protein